jgi:hypothetical protein
MGASRCRVPVRSAIVQFYLSTIALVLGGFLNAELERHAGAPAPDRSMY